MEAMHIYANSEQVCQATMAFGIRSSRLGLHLPIGTRLGSRTQWSAMSMASLVNTRAECKLVRSIAHNRN